MIKLLESFKIKYIAKQEMKGEKKIKKEYNLKKIENEK
jgi:hypothetical protein